MSQKILITGSQGMVGTELKNHLDFIAVGRDDADITNEDQVKAMLDKHQPDLVVHLAAYTNVAKAETERALCYAVNVNGTDNLARHVPHLIYMSTEYVFDGEEGNYDEAAIPNPVNFYSLTKLLGECMATKAPKYSIIRTLMKPRPYKYDAVPGDMYTAGDYVDTMCKEYAIAIKHAEQLPAIINIGTGRKSLLELARQTRDVYPIERKSLPVKLPADTSLNLERWQQFKTQLKEQV